MGHDVTLSQYRLLVVLSIQGPQRMVELAANLESTLPRPPACVTASNVRAWWPRQRLSSDRRAVQLVATRAGHELVGAVIAQRRAEIGRILAAMPSDQHRQVAEGLRLFCEAAGEVPDRHWTVGWRR